MKKVYATLKALLDVLDFLVGESDTSELGRRIKEEVFFFSSRIKQYLKFT